MTVAATITAIQTLNATLGTAPADYPTSMETSELPCFLTYAGPGMTRWDSHGGDLKRRERVYIIRCYVMDLEQGVGVNEGMQAAIEMLDSAIALYEVTDDLPNGAQIHLSDDDSQAIRDSGVRSDLTYGTRQYRGFEVQLSIWEWTG